MKVETDLEQVREAVSRNRQRISITRAELEETSGKNFSDKTLNRFIKKTIAACKNQAIGKERAARGKFTD